MHPTILFHASWNLGGAKLAVLPVGLKEVERSTEVRVHFVSVQEERGPRLGLLAGGRIRDADTWRCCGICYRTAEWSLMRKKWDSRGLWLRLRRISDGIQLWVGSAHLTQGATKEQHASESHSFMQKLPASSLPVCFGVDANTPFAWGLTGDGMIPTGKEAKGEGLLALLRERGAHLTAPPGEQIHWPTCRPRRQDVRGRHIDVVGGIRATTRGVGIVEGSYAWVGSDHDAVVQQVEVRVPTGNYGKRPNTRPKQVVGEVCVPEVVNQDALVNMARECTKPYSGMAYKDDETVKQYFRVARRTRRPEDWKQALRARAQARTARREEHIRQATEGNWRAYKEVAKRGGKGWEDHFATEMVEKGEDPHAAVHEHFQTLYSGPALCEFPFVDVPVSADFTVEEMRHAICCGKNGKSTGKDGVPHELLVALAKEEGGETKLLAWYNRLLHNEEPIPESWATAVMVILPKCAQPHGPKQLRPICLGDAASKVFSRLLLGRTRPSLRYHGQFQCMGEGRQTVDYIWVIARLMSLDAEWRYGLYFVKLDIAKAFDLVDRNKMLMRLAGKMGPCEELRCWWHLFKQTDARLDTVWGSSTVSMLRGIRQGAVESPLLFAAVMDWVATDTACKHQWAPQDDVYKGLEFAEAAFVDDCLLWNGSKRVLEQRILQFTDELQEWGLKVNPDKSQAYASPFVSEKHPGVLKVRDKLVPFDVRLDVMNIPFHVGINAKDALKVVFAKVKNKFWSQKHLFRAKTPLKGRMRLIQKVLGGSALWCVSAFFPDKGALQAINQLQLQLIMWAMRLSRSTLEAWVEFRAQAQGKIFPQADGGRENAEQGCGRAVERGGAGQEGVGCESPMLA